MIADAAQTFGQEDDITVVTVRRADPEEPLVDRVLRSTVSPSPA